MTDAFLRFMASGQGRALRIAAGAGLVAWGLSARRSTGGKVAALAGLAPLVTGLTDRCVLPAPTT